MSFLRDRIIALLSERQLKTLMYDLGFFDAREIDAEQLRELFLTSEEIEEDVMLGLLSVTVLRKLGREFGITGGKSRKELEGGIIKHANNDHSTNATGDERISSRTSSVEHRHEAEAGQDSATREVSSKHRKSLDVDGIRVPLDLIGCTNLRLYERGGMWLLASQRSKKLLGRFATEDDAENWLGRFNEIRGLEHRSLVKAAPMKAKQVLNARKKRKQKRRSTLSSFSDTAGPPGWRSRSLDLLDQKWAVSGGGANGTGKRR